MISDPEAYTLLETAVGAFSCRTPRIPRMWTPSTRPHAALLMPLYDRLDRIYLTRPVGSGDECEIEVYDFSTLPEKSLVEIRFNSRHYDYYRKDGITWVKVGHAEDPFVMEVFSAGGFPVVITLTG